MKLKTLRLSIIFLALFSLLISCDNDDDGGTTTIELEDRTEQQVKDSDSIVLYLSTHYYNSAYIASSTDPKYTDIIITELPIDETTGEYLDMPDPDNNTLLIDAVTTYTTTYLEADYEYYVLHLNQGDGASPNFTDEIRVRYEGTSINDDGDIFDVIATPGDLLLQGDGFSTFGTIRAWQLVMPMFNTADGFDLVDGIVDYNNFGLGVMFVPSGLGYFAGTSTGSSYDNLMFKFELLQFEVEDHDNDGIPSYLEDLDNSTDVFDDDTDEDGFPNYIDFDDDGDDVSTFNELLSTTYSVDTNVGEEEPTLAAEEFEYSRSEEAGVITINTVTVVDSNSDGTPDYLDATIAIDYNEEEE